jgi:hypothetical protein
MQSLICKQCNSTLRWDGVSEVVRCDYCGTMYRMHPRTSAGPERGVRTGAGTVSPIETSRGGYAGYALARSYIPEGWRVETNAPETESNLLVPLTMQVQYAAPDDSAAILYTGTRAYAHLEMTPQTAAQQGRLQLPERKITLAYRDAAAICDGVVSGSRGFTGAQLVSETKEPDEKVLATYNKTMQEYAQANTLNPGGSWTRRVYRGTDNEGRTVFKQVEALVTYAFLPVSPQEMQLWQMLQQSRMRTMGLMGSMRGGAGLLGGLMSAANMAASGTMQPPQPKMHWTAHYVLETAAAEAAFRQAQGFSVQIRDSFEALPLMQRETERLRQSIMAQARQDQNTIDNAYSQMARDRMASWDRRRAIMQDASDYGTQVMREMQANTARTNETVANLHSEAIRGVNTYYAAQPFGSYSAPPVVEADVRWDHVYQNTQHPDWFAAREGDAPLEFGVDYEELKNTGGHY